MKNIAVILLLGIGGATAAPKEVSEGIYSIGKIAHPALKECSGTIPSRSDTNLFWMHTDGNRPFLFGTYRDGGAFREYAVGAPTMVDWEDIATDYQGHLYLGDIGNNDARRNYLMVYRVAEPAPQGEVAGRSLKIERAWVLKFPGAPFDCEALFIWQQQGYVISKVFDDRQAEIYKFPLEPADGAVELELVTRLRITSPVTAADLSRDGRQLAVAAKNGLYLFDIDGRIEKAGQLEPRQAKFKDKRIEGCCFVPDGVLATAETRRIYLFTDKAFTKSEDKAQ